MPNRAAPLGLDTPRATGRSGLHRGEIVDAAIALADTGGLDAVSIRKVAAQLRVRPMSLYTHVASKDDLLRLMGESVVAEVLAGEPLPTGWRAALTELAERSHATFVRHPWLPEISGRRPHLGANAVRHAEQLLQALSELDLPAPEAWAVLSAVNDYTLGHALRVVNAPGGERGRFPDFDSDAFPRLGAALGAAGSARDEATFRAGLELLLDGVAARYAAEGSENG